MEDIKCAICRKELKKGDTVYQDRYFFNYHCSWEHLVEYMEEFFYIKKGETIVLGEEDE